jgi:peptidoglycan/LPS O-acetylase OafA/YrhL
VGGYDDAMAFTSTSWIVWLMLAGALAAAIAVVYARRLPLAARLGALGLVLFAMKTALTRPDGPHVLPGYTLVVLVLLVAFVAGTPFVVRAWPHQSRCCSAC